MPGVPHLGPRRSFACGGADGGRQNSFEKYSFNYFPASCGFITRTSIGKREKKTSLNNFYATTTRPPPLVPVRQPKQRVFGAFHSAATLS